MYIGDTFKVAGYDVLATIDHHQGQHEILVLNNNHNYFLVASVRKGRPTLAILEAEYEYVDEEEAEASFTRAVIRAARLATPEHFWPKGRM